MRWHTRNIEHQVSNVRKCLSHIGCLYAPTIPVENPESASQAANRTELVSRQSNRLTIRCILTSYTSTHTYTHAEPPTYRRGSKPWGTQTATPRSPCRTPRHCCSPSVSRTPTTSFKLCCLVSSLTSLRVCSR